jgi:hypothetical protein
MASITFNPITYANKLKEAGMAARIADVQAEEMVNMINTHIATKEDLIAMEYRLKTDLKEFMIKALVTGFGSMTTILGIVMFFIK